jgi:signal transduction histidine kinase
VGHKSDVPAGRLLSVAAYTNELLLAPGSQEHLFNSIAQVYAEALSHPIVAILLFDEDRQEARVAGINDGQMALLKQRRGPAVLYKRSYPLADIRQLDWMRAMSNGDIHISNSPVELLMPFVSSRSMGTLVRKFKILQGLTLPLVARGNLMGALKVGSTRDKLDLREREELVTMALHLAIAAEIWQLHDRAEGRSAVLTRLHSLSQTITGILDLDTLFAEVVRAAGKLARIDFCSVSTFTRDIKGYVNRAVWRKDEDAVVSSGTFSVGVFTPDILRRALKAEQPILVPDLGVYPDAQERLARWNVKSVAFFAFRAGGKPVGFVAVGREEPGAWDQSTVEILEELTEYLAIAFHNAYRYAEAARHAVTQTALAENARLIAHADTDSVLQTIVQAGSQLLMSSQCALFLPDRKGGLVCAAIAGPNTENIRGYTIGSDEGLLGKAYTKQRAILTDDIQKAAGSAYRNEGGLVDLGSFLAIPMLTEQGCIGVLAASHRETALYSQAYVDLLTTLADHATIALEKARLLQEAKTQASEQAALAESAAAIARLDVHTVLQTIVARACEIVKDALCTVFLYDEKTNELYWAAGHNDGPELQKLRLHAAAGLVGQAYTTGQALLVPDLRRDKRSIAARISEIKNLRSLVAAPLKGASETLGVLVLSHTQVNTFTQHDLYLLETFADYATIALSNARLYASLQQREGERSRLLHQLLTSQDAERRRVAVDIHDGPLQSIAVNMLAVDRARKLVEMGRTADARNELVEVHNGMAEIVQELRDLISDLRPAVLESLGLVVAAAAHLDQFTTQTGIVSYLEDERDGKRVPANIEVIFYPLLQDAITNVRKHAGATTVWVRFSIYDGLFRMDVTDNGRGFDPVVVAAQSLENGHIGLHSMQERIDSAGGGMEIDSFQDKGTRITFWTPIIEGQEPQRTGNDEGRADAETS